MNKVQKVILIIILVLLCIPLIEMMDGNSQVNWSIFDFIIAFIILIAVGFSMEWVFRKIQNKRYKIALGILILSLFILLWGELAVGIFGSPIAGD
jgi:peptidoglycan/LPS O-acetylase OafA/YrhL